jgi:hypothetical protein
MGAVSGDCCRPQTNIRPKTATTEEDIKMNAEIKNRFSEAVNPQRRTKMTTRISTLHIAADEKTTGIEQVMLCGRRVHTGQVIFQSDIDNPQYSDLRRYVCRDCLRKFSDRKYRRSIRIGENK